MERLASLLISVLNFSLAYKPQEIIYEIHSMGCELKNLNKRTME